MRAVLCNEWGGPEKLLLKDMPSPAIREGAVRIAVHAAGINFADLLLISGQYQEKPAFPFTPGMELAGVVTEVGAGVKDLKAGDRGMALSGAGASKEKLGLAKQHGADHLIDYSREDIRERVKAITGGRGADVVYDPVGGDAFDASLRSIAWGGRILIIGFAGGRIPQIPANILLVKNIDVIGFYWGSYQSRKPDLLRQGYAQLFRWFEEGKLKPHVSQTFDLAHVAGALDSLRQRKSTGKVVLTTSLGA